MTYFSNHSNQIELVLLTFALLLAIYQLIRYKKVEKWEAQRLAVLIDALENEKKEAISYLNTSKKIALLEKTTQQKLRIITVDILTIRFTLQETFSS